MGDLVELLSAVFAAQENGTWERLKACAECHWALYDHTKNRSASWCDPAKCGAGALLLESPSQRASA
jgi:predicted RNA-binding Zn ribbon-like protein